MSTDSISLLNINAAEFQLSAGQSNYTTDAMVISAINAVPFSTSGPDNIHVDLTNSM